MTYDPETRTAHIGRAHKIATELSEEGFDEVSGSIVLSMALGIFVEGFEGAHRNIEPLLKAHLTSAQMAFDALRMGRSRKPGAA